MKAIVNEPNNILEYFRLTYNHMSLIRAVVHTIKDVKRWPLMSIARIEIASASTGMASCAVEFLDRSSQMLEFEERGDNSYAIARPSTEIVVSRAESKAKQKRGRR